MLFNFYRKNLSLYIVFREYAGYIHYLIPYPICLPMSLISWFISYHTFHVDKIIGLTYGRINYSKIISKWRFIKDSCERTYFGVW